MLPDKAVTLVQLDGSSIRRLPAYVAPHFKREGQLSKWMGLGFGKDVNYYGVLTWVGG
jgi:hypothetical protein